MFLLISCPVAPVRTVHQCCVSDLMQLQLGDTDHYTKKIIFLPDCTNNKNILCDLHQALQLLLSRENLYFLNMFII